jgi:hypothetical protein
MSLDFYLTETRPVLHEETHKYWLNGLPQVTKHQFYYEGTVYLFDINITHNLNTMAGKAGIYKALWRPDENGWTKAKQLVPMLAEGLAKLKADPEYYRQFNAKNGWGTYVYFVPFVEKVLWACAEYPEADVHVSR